MKKEDEEIKESNLRRLIIPEIPQRHNANVKKNETRKIPYKRVFFNNKLI